MAIVETKDFSGATGGHVINAAMAAAFTGGHDTVLVNDQGMDYDTTVTVNGRANVTLKFENENTKLFPTSSLSQLINGNISGRDNFKIEGGVIDGSNLCSSRVIQVGNSGFNTYRTEIRDTKPSNVPTWDPSILPADLIDIRDNAANVRLKDTLVRQGNTLVQMTRGFNDVTLERCYFDEWFNRGVYGFGNNNPSENLDLLFCGWGVPLVSQDTSRQPMAIQKSPTGTPLPFNNMRILGAYANCLDQPARNNEEGLGTEFINPGQWVSDVLSQHFTTNSSVAFVKLNNPNEVGIAVSLEAQFAFLWLNTIVGSWTTGMSFGSSASSVSNCLCAANDFIDCGKDMTGDHVNIGPLFAVNTTNCAFLGNHASHVSPPGTVSYNTNGTPYTADYGNPRFGAILRDNVDLGEFNNSLFGWTQERSLRTGSAFKEIGITLPTAELLMPRGFHPDVRTSRDQVGRMLDTSGPEDYDYMGMMQRCVLPEYSDQWDGTRFGVVRYKNDMDCIREWARLYWQERLGQLAAPERKACVLHGGIPHDDPDNTWDFEQAQIGIYRITFAASGPRPELNIQAFNYDVPFVITEHVWLDFDTVEIRMRSMTTNEAIDCAFILWG